MPQHVTVVRVEAQRGAAVAVMRADMEPAVVMSDGDLLHVAEFADLLLPDDCAGLLVQRDDPVAAAVGIDLAVSDGDTAAGQGAPRLPVHPLRHPGATVDGKHIPRGRPDVEHAGDGHGRALVRAGREATLDPVDPGTADAADVAVVDAAQRRVVLVAVVSADLREVATAGGRRERSGNLDIASGGAGHLDDFAPAVAAGADAVLAASVFHFGEISIGEVKQALRHAGHPVR